MRSTLRGRLVLLLGVVVTVTCVVLVGAASVGSALLLRKEQNGTIGSLASGLCQAVMAEEQESPRDLIAAAKEYFGEAGVAGYRYELLGRDGSVLASSAPLAGWDPEAWSIPASSYPSTPVPRAGAAVRGRFRGQAKSCTAGLTIRVVTQDVLFEHPARRVAGVLLAVIPIALGAGLLLGRAGIGKALRPLNDLEQAARRIDADSQLALGVGTKLRELARLERAFDDLIARLGAALARERQFTQEASHELRTPLTVLRARVEQCAAAGSTRDQSEHLAVITGELDHLDALVESLLVLARSDDAPLPRELVNLCDAVRDAVRRQECVDGRGRRPIEVDAPDEILVRGSEDLIHRAIGNLLENSRKFAGPGGRILLRVSSEAARAVITAEDDGPGIPEESRPYVFDRFFRDPTHRQASDGVGLGLAVVRAVVARHGGTVAAGRSELGGAAFRLEFPLP